MKYIVEVTAHDEALLRDILEALGEAMGGKTLETVVLKPQFTEV